MSRRKPIEDVYFWQFLQRYRAEVFDQRKLSTQTTAKTVFSQLVLAFGHLKMSQITSRVLQVYYTSLTKTYAPATLAKSWAVLSGVLRYAYDEGLIGDYRRPHLPRKTRTAQRWLTLEEMRLMIQKADSGHLRTLVMVLAETGCRIGEALGLQSRHLDTEKLTISFDQNVFNGIVQTPKTESSYRTLAISPTLCYALNAIQSKGFPESFIFPCQRPGTVRHWMNKIFDRAGIPRKGEHSFRRGNATWLIRTLGMDPLIASERLGHKTGDFTLDIYVQKMDGADRPWIEKIEEGLYG